MAHRIHRSKTAVSWRHRWAGGGEESVGMSRLWTTWGLSLALMTAPSATGVAMAAFPPLFSYGGAATRVTDRRGNGTEWVF